MTKKINRRTFITKSSKVALSAFVGGSVLPYLSLGTLREAQASKQADISVVTGENYFNNTLKAVELLGFLQEANDWVRENV